MNWLAYLLYSRRKFIIVRNTQQRGLFSVLYRGNYCYYRNLVFGGSGLTDSPLQASAFLSKSEAWEFVHRYADEKNISNYKITSKGYY